MLRMFQFDEEVFISLFFSFTPSQIGQVKMYHTLPVLYKEEEQNSAMFCGGFYSVLKGTTEQYFLMADRSLS